MKKLALILLTFFSLYSITFADIAPCPIVVKSVFTADSCKIRMLSEVVYANLYHDSATVECTFEMLNYGDSITIEVGFPEMNFQYWCSGEYSENDKMNFEIYVDGNRLTDKEIGVPKEMEDIYQKYMYVYHIEKEYRAKVDSAYKANNMSIEDWWHVYQPNTSHNKTKMALDSLYKWRDTEPYLGSDLWSEFDAQKKKGNFPWYVWKVHFKAGEKKIIKVTYNLPSGMGYRAQYRYFKYLLNTGAGWYDNIEKAEVILQLHNINMKNIEEITPKNYCLDTQNKTIIWNFKNLEPTNDDDIYVRYFKASERKNLKKYSTKRYKVLRKAEKERRKKQ